MHMLPPSKRVEQRVWYGYQYLLRIGQHHAREVCTNECNRRLIHLGLRVQCCCQYCITDNVVVVFVGVIVIVVVAYGAVVVIGVVIDAANVCLMLTMSLSSLLLLQPSFMLAIIFAVDVSLVGCRHSYCWRDRGGMSANTSVGPATKVQPKDYTTVFEVINCAPSAKFRIS